MHACKKNVYKSVGLPSDRDDNRVAMGYRVPGPRKILDFVGLEVDLRARFFLNEFFIGTKCLILGGGLKGP